MDRADHLEIEDRALDIDRIVRLDATDVAGECADLVLVGIDLWDMDPRLLAAGAVEDPQLRKLEWQAITSEVGSRPR